jgi:hypothetical protein
VYVISLSPDLADEAVTPTQKLTRFDHFGQYGTIKKCVVNTANAYSHPAGPSYSAYVTFHNDEDAAKCIKAIDGFVIHDRELSATYGTTKYCAYFLKSVKCPKAECLYLHALGLPEDTLTRDGTAQLKLAKAYLLQFFNIEVDPPGILKTVLPSARLIRARNLSMDTAKTPSRVERRFSLITPDRTCSRFEFVQADSEETPGEVPPHITSIVSINSQLNTTAQIPAKHITTLLGPNSPDYWIGELIDCDLQEVVRRLSMDDDGTVLVKAKSVL